MTLDAPMLHTGRLAAAPPAVTSRANGAALQLAVVVPVLNEADNVLVLADALVTALEGLCWEVLFVDDGSRDGTLDRLRALAVHDRRFRLIQRIGRRGLASAVVEGVLASVAPVAAVIDGDGQHDETVLPRLYTLVADGACDVAVATRYAEGGSTGSWSNGRRRLSEAATRWAKALLGVTLSDPMSGFFAVRRDVVEAVAPRLSNIGWKILLDLVASSPTPLRTVETPYTFRERRAGDSKLDLRTTQEFVILVLEKLLGRFVPVRFLMFAAVGSIGLLVHLAVLGMAMAGGLEFRWAQTAAVMVAVAFNFLLNNSVTYRDIRLRGVAFWRGLLAFYGVSLVGAVGDVGVGAMVYRYDQVWWLAGAAGVAVGVVWNFAASSAVTWRPGAGR